MSHNLSQNYFSATGTSDGKMKRDILLSEIAKKIYTDRQGVIENLKLAGFGVPKKVDDKTLVSMVSSALNRSKRFAKMVAKDVVATSGGARDSRSSSASYRGVPKGTSTGTAGIGIIGSDGEYYGGEGKTDWGKLIGDASKIVGGLGSIFGGKKRAAADLAAAEAEKARAEQELADKLAAIKTTEKTGSNMVYWIVGGLLVAGVVGTTIYLIVRK